MELKGVHMKVNILSLTILVLVLGACQDKKSTANMAGTSELEVQSLMAESAVSSLNSALNDSEQSSSYALARPASPVITESFQLIPQAWAASCDLSRFSPAIGSANCNGTVDGKTVTSTFNSCTVGSQNQWALTGLVTLSFDNASTCDAWIKGIGFPTSGSLTRTTSNFLRTNPNGSYVTTVSDASNNYAGKVISGGVKTSFLPDSRSVEILGLHRERRTAFGQLVFDHSVYTTSPIVVSGSRLAGNRQVQSGTIRVDHNLAKFSNTASFAGIKWSASCCHPVDGTVNFTLSGSKSGTVKVDFNTGTCGTAKLTNNAGVQTQVEMSACE